MSQASEHTTHVLMLFDRYIPEKGTPMLKNARKWIQDNQENVGIGLVVAGSAASTIITVMLAIENDRLKQQRDEAKNVANFMLDANLGGYMATMDDEGIVKFVNMVPQE